MMEAVNYYSKAYKLDPKLEDEEYALKVVNAFKPKVKLV